MKNFYFGILVSALSMNALATQPIPVPHSNYTCTEHTYSSTAENTMKTTKTIRGQDDVWKPMVTGSPGKETKWDFGQLFQGATFAIIPTERQPLKVTLANSAGDGPYDRKSGSV